MSLLNVISSNRFRGFAFALTIMAVCITFLLSPLSLAETITFNNSWGDAGFNLVSQDAAGVEVVFSIEEFALEDMVIDGQTMQMVYLPGVFLPNNAGAPNLPGMGRYIAIPEGASVRVRIVDSKTEIYQGVDLAPAPPIPLETDDSPPVYKQDPAIYSHNAYYPDSPVKISEPTDIRGVDAIIMGITPFQYNPVTRELLVYRDLRVKIDFVGGNGHFGEDRLRSRHWEPILRGNLLNYSSLPAVNFNRINQLDRNNWEYLIIVPDDPAFIAWADSIKEWRTLQGIYTGVVTLAEIGGNNSTLIENYINNAYATWDPAPVAVLLLSDYQSTGDIYGITSPLYSGIVSDNIYADVNGNNLPNIALARITAQNYQHLATMVEKFLDYERDPPTAANFYDNPLIAGGWQSDRWFILCCEVIYGYMENVLGKHPVRQYAGTSGPPSQWSTNTNTYMIIDYFGPNGLGYIPATPSHLTNWSGNATGINNAINNGAFIVQHRDHGSENGWADPSYHNSDLSGLYNDMLTFVFSINCLTGKYNWSSECFAEAFHRMEHGALGVIAASGVSYSFVNDTYVWGMYDSMWPDFDPGYGNDLTGPNDLRPCFASAYGKHYLQASNWPYNPQSKNITYHLFHHHGDAFTTLYSEVPQNLTVLHQPAMLGGMDVFSVTANEGSIISLTVDGEIIGVAEGTGAPVDIEIDPQIPGSTMLVTVTLYNHYRYTQEVPVVPPSGAYVVFNAVDINDAGAWMPNGQLDFGEDVLLSITVENIGNDNATNVDITITTDDIYTTVIDGSENYGNIAANTTAMVPDGFEIMVTEDVPDMHNISFELSATDGDSVWISNFTLTAHAPILEFERLVIDDPTGNNNHQLDPGETADFNVSIKNNGSTNASNIEVILSTTEPLITIPNNSATITDLVAGAEATVVYENIEADASMSAGTGVDFTLDITADGGYENEDGFSIVVGDIRYQPTGPDAHGYWAYDMYDGVGAPVYDWVEIAPSAGGPGINLNLGDDQTGHVNLPFTFRYYGSDFTQISICSNGWIAMGYTTSTDWSNSGIPNSDGPPNMIAPLWDDLNPAVGGQVCWYSDAANHRLIVEWYQVPYYSGGGSATIQTILFDPAYYPTLTGDGEIQVNYNNQSNISSCTVGIENSTETVGIQFLYDGNYDEHAMPLESGFAIKYTTLSSLGGDLTLTLEPQGAPIVIPANGGSFNYDITIENVGVSTAYFQAWIDVMLPNSTWRDLLLRSGLMLGQGASINRSMTQNVPGWTPAGTYEYWGHAGVYPSDPWAEDYFTFEKAAGDFEGESEYTNWSLSGWDEGEGLASALPTEFGLSQNYPNPFNPETSIDFALPEAVKVNLSVYNLLGQRVATLYEGMTPAGYYTIRWEASNLSSGVYFYHLQAGDFNSIKKCILMK